MGSKPPPPPPIEITCTYNIIILINAKFRGGAWRPPPQLWQPCRVHTHNFIPVLIP